MDAKGDVRPRTATLGGGCFWCIEAVYKMLPGVVSVVNGYAGGRSENPDYEDVCSGSTGHAEVVQITYDPSTVTYQEILELFWSAHDPTTLNRQGADVGSQYRSIILCEDENERDIAEMSKHAAQSRFEYPIVTEIALLGKFYPAERYHQNYYSNHPENPYCALVITPKVEKLRPRIAAMIQ